MQQGEGIPMVPECKRQAVCTNGRRCLDAGRCLAGEGMVLTQRLCRHKGDRGECLTPDCNCPPLAEPDTRCDTAAPSDDAVDAALSMFARMLHPSRVPDRHAVQWALSAAMPRREAEVRAEERAATLREVEAWMRERAEQQPHDWPWASFADALAAHFNPEAE